MNKIALLFVLLLNIITYGQENPISKVDLPNFTPPSPEAFQITKYGDAGVDEFNGKVNLNIPLFQYQAGQLKFPISLNYYGSGVKVSDIATQTGINWTLDAGGVISREIRDLCDEEAWVTGKRKIFSESELINLNKLDCSNEAAQLRTYIDQDYDTEIDIFKFHFLSYSGSFYLDDNFIPQMVKNDQHLKIEIVGSLYTEKTFTITDPYGVKYYFGGINATENTQSRSLSGSTQQLNAGGPTSFFLYKVEHPIDGTVLLEYGSLSPIEIPLSISYSKSVTTSEVFDCANSQSGSHSSMRNSILDQKYLTRIYNLNNSDILEFNRTFINNINFKFFLNSINFKKGNNLFSTVDFSYIGLQNPTDANRFFLNKISFNKDFIPAQSTGKKNEEYRMEYNDAENLPARFSRSIDLLGYYNGINNSTLVPCSPEDIATNSTFCPNRKANFEYSSKGVLKSIYYPTGGHTNFEYESQPTIEKDYEGIGAGVYINSDSEGDTLHTNLYETLQVKALYGQDVNISLSANTLDNVPKHYALVTLKVTNLTKNPNEVNTYICATGTKIIPFRFLINDIYKFEISIVKPTATYVGYSANGGFNLALHSGYKRVEGSGVRIKRTTDFADSNSIPISKRFYYTSYNQMQDLFADTFTSSQRITSSGFIYSCHGLPIRYYTQTYHSNYDYSDYTYQTFRGQDYANVTVSYGGDHFENGGVEKTFLLSEESDYGQLFPLTSTIYNIPYTVPDAKDNVFSLDGTLLKERIYSNINGVVYKIQEKKTQYEYPLQNKKLNIFGFETYRLGVSSGGCPSTSTLSNYFIGTYYTNSYLFNKKSQKEILYVDPVPANLISWDENYGVEDPLSQEHLETTYKKIITTTDYEYGNLKGLPTKVIKKNSNDEEYSTKYVYADQANTLIGLSPQNLTAFSSLYNRNIIATPIQTTQSKDNKVLATQRVLYKTSAANSNQILQDYIQISKGNLALENKVSFSEYDSRGNPSIVSLIDGSKIKYFYNDYNQVIVKIENYTGALNVFGDPIGSTNPCDFINQYPTSLVTIFKYNPATNQISSIISSNCKTTTYVYDKLHHLENIRDDNNNILQHFEYNYQTPN